VGVFRYSKVYSVGLLNISSQIDCGDADVTLATSKTCPRKTRWGAVGKLRTIDGEYYAKRSFEVREKTFRTNKIL
jgi:hypothetical protein